MRPRLAGFLRNAALLLAACVVALLGAEIAVRVLFPHARDHVVPAGLFEIDDRLGWRLSGGRAGVHRSRYFEAEYRTNGLGFRDAERSITRPEGTRRLLIYGDSQVFGWGLPAEQRFTDLLENALDGLEVWNLAVPGYGLGQQVIAYERDAARYEPDEACFLITPSTLFRIPFDYIFRKPKPRFRLDESGALLLDPVQAQSRALSSTLYAALSPFYLPYFVDRRLQQLGAAGRAGDGPRPRETPWLDDLVGGILLRAKETAGERGQRVCLLASFPDAGPLADLRAFAERHDMGYLEIAADRNDPALVFGPHDTHWNALAHRRIAEQLLVQLGPSPPVPPAANPPRR